MFHLQKTKSVAAILGTGVTNGETVTARFDTLGFANLSLDVILGTSNTVSNKPSTLKLSESDDTVVTNFADIATFANGTSTGNYTMPNANTSNPNIYRFDVDLRGRKRYLLLTVTPLTTQAVVAAGRLSRGENVIGSTASDYGALATVRG
jgi:hypothetical protein